MDRYSRRDQSANKRFRKVLHKTLAGVLCALLVLGNLTFFIWSEPKTVSANVAISGTYDYSMAYRVFQMVNAERKSRGLSELVFDGKYQSRSDLRSSEANVLWSHTRPNGQDWSSVFLTDALPGSLLGENLAWNVGYEDPGGNAVIQWLESPGHREQMLTPEYVTTSVSVFLGTDGYYFMQFFSTAPYSGQAPITSGQQSVTLSIDDGTSVPIDTPTPIPTNTPTPTQPVFTPTSTPTPFAIIPPTAGPGPNITYSTPTPQPTSTPTPRATNTPTPTTRPSPTAAPTRVPTKAPTPIAATPTTTAPSVTGISQATVSPTPVGEEVTSEEDTGETETGEEESSETETGEEGSTEEKGSESETETPHVESIRFLIEDSDRILKVGDIYELQIQVAPIGADPSEVVFYSTDSDVILMEGNVIHAVGEGTTTILAQAGGVTSSVPFQVSSSGDAGNVVREGTMKPETEDGGVVFTSSMLDILTSEFADVALRVNFRMEGEANEDDTILLELTDTTGRSYRIPIKISTLMTAVRIDMNESETDSEPESESEAESGSEPEGETGEESESETGEEPETESEPESEKDSEEILSERDIELTLTGRQILRAIEAETGKSMKNVIFQSGEMKVISGGDNTIVLVKVDYHYSIPEEALKRIEKLKADAERSQEIESSAAIIHIEEEDLDAQNHIKVLGGIILTLSLILFIFVILFLIMLVKSVFGINETPAATDDSHYGRRSGDTPRRRLRPEKKSVPSPKKKKTGSGSDETGDLTSDLTSELLPGGPGQHTDHGNHAAEQAGVAHEPAPMDRRNPGRRSTDRK